MKSGTPIGSALPSRRDSQIVEAGSAQPSRDLDIIVAPKARDRLLELIEREQLPGDVRDTLAGALTGDLRRQQLLFQAMVDTWPRLQKNLNEVFREVKKAPWEFTPCKLRGKEVDKSAVEKAELAEDTFWTMQPRSAYSERGGKGLIEDIAYGYFAGHQVVEMRWTRDESGVRPRASKVVSGRFYGYPYDDQDEDRLMFNPDGGMSGYIYEDFADHHFLLAINGGHPGHPSVAAPLRALTGYWLAATFGLKWLLQFAQLYGVPFRFANYADINDKEKVCSMLENIGSSGWGAFPQGTKIDFVDASKSANALPQKDLIEMADNQCDTFILGQTLTTDVGDSGSRALGDVHQDVRMAMIEGVADFVADVLNEQYLPSLIELNYGDREEVPTVSAAFEKPKNEKGMAERDRTLFKDLGLPVEKSWLYERHGVPMPDEDSNDLFQPTSNGVQGDPATGGDTPPHETKARLEARDSGLTWSQFEPGTGTLGIPRAEMPQIYSNNRSALVGFLKARGIISSKQMVPAGTLKPTQIDYSPEKIRPSSDFKGKARSILVSSDDHVVDGHHQWLAALEAGEEVPILRIDAPIVRLLNLAHQMPSTKVAASDAKPSTIDQLVDNTLEDLTGVTKEWLAPVRPTFERLAALAMSKNVSDEDFIKAIEKAQKEMPELFDKLNTDALQESMDRAIGTAMLSGSVSRYE